MPSANFKPNPEEINSVWKELVADVMLIDKVQTYGMHKHANKVALAFGRCVLIAIGVYFTYFIGCTRGEQYYGLFAFTAIIIAETLYVCLRRNGIDFKWFSVSYLAFSLQFVAGLWVGSEWSHALEDIECKGNETTIEHERMRVHCSIVI